MKLIKLELENICQHRHTVMEFGTGLIGIYGPNGSGKSNAMNVGCYATITNDYSRHEQGKMGMICQQAGIEERSRMSLIFEQDGHEYTLTRGLRHPVTHCLTRPGEEDLVKARQIEHELEEVLGVKRRLIDDYMFVPQGELSSFLSDTPAERSRSFAHLCNTTHAELVWDLLGTQITADQPMADEVIDRTDEIRSQIADFKARLAPIKEQLAAARKHLHTKNRVELFQALVNSHRDWQAAKAKVPGLEKVIEHKRLVAVAAIKKWTVAASAVVPLVTALEEMKSNYAASLLKSEANIPKYDKARETLAKMEEAAKRVERKKVVESQLVAEEAKLEALVLPIKPPGELAVLDEQRLTVGGDYASAKKLLLAQLDLDVDAECPTCGTPLADCAEHIEKVRASIPSLENRIAALDASIAAIVQNKKACDKYAADVRMREGNIQHFRDELTTLQGAEVVGKSSELMMILVDHREHLRGLAESRSEIALEEEELSAKVRAERQLDTAKERLIATHQGAKKQLKELLSEVDYLTVDATEAEEATAKLAQHKEAQLAVAGHKSRIEELSKFIDTQREDLARVKEQLARNERARRWVQILTEVRDEVMHRDRLPRIVHKNYLCSMIDSVNETLVEFNAPFYVTPVEGVGFMAHFPNGTIMPAPGLSGGQKVVLALAFRLTVNSIFAPQLGTMILDEPTDGLDTENRQLAAEFFQKLGVVARSRGLQITVISHDDEMERIFDQKILLERPV